MKVSIVAILRAFLCLAAQHGGVLGMCYFPQVFQGEYVTQVPNKEIVVYNSINITPNAIPIWGNCHKRKGNNYVLKLSYRETSCIRCVHLKLRSKNVLQVLASRSEIFSECFTNEDAAELYCPSEDVLDHNKTEIILYKTKDVDESFSRKAYCPFDGSYSVKYSYDKYSKYNCAQLDTTVDSCPSGSILNTRFPKCYNQNLDFSLECLGHWSGPNNQNFIIFSDSRYPKHGVPKYRCGLYERDANTGLVKMALSKDSTCTSSLKSPEDGHETFTLEPKPESPWPPEITYMQCRFPEWLSDNWNHIRMEDNTITYKDQTSYKTYTIKCVGIVEKEDKYLIFSRTQCNEEQYNCMKIKKRGDNIVEIQMGTHFNNTSNTKLCGDDNFDENSWVTQSRSNASTGLSCPISGEYVGLIPDSSELCAKLWSDCQTPELMYYQVSECATGEIYEEREYRCLGHWQEGDLLYTYTQRFDGAAGTFECFVGSIVSNQEIYIKEAGEHCQRHVDPFRFGMKLKHKQDLYSCIDNPTTKRSRTSTRKSTAGTTTAKRTTSLVPKTTTKPWVAHSYPPTGYDTNSISAGEKFRTASWSLLVLLVLKLHLTL